MISSAPEGSTPWSSERWSLMVLGSVKADTPTDIPAKGWKDVLTRVYLEFQKDRVLSVAAGPGVPNTTWRRGRDGWSGPARPRRRPPAAAR
jgi:hypothetical protein